ncbi:MAG: hypothetical protein ACT4PT_04330 [Methanobacteriota archaeon]
MSLPRPVAIEGRGPTLQTMHEIENILRDADGPLSLNEIKRRMRARAVRHAVVRSTVDEFVRLGLAAEGEKGVFWSLNTSVKAWDRLRGKRLA